MRPAVFPSGRLPGCHQSASGHCGASGRCPWVSQESYGSGKLRKVIQESTGAAETFLAHQLPDQYSAMATPVGLLVLLFVFDWRLGLLSLVPVFLAFAIMATHDWGTDGRKNAPVWQCSGSYVQ